MTEKRSSGIQSRLSWFVQESEDEHSLEPEERKLQDEIAIFNRTVQNLDDFETARKVCSSLFCCSNFTRIGARLWHRHQADWCSVSSDLSFKRVPPEEIIQFQPSFSRQMRTSMEGKSQPFNLLEYDSVLLQMLFLTLESTNYSQRKESEVVFSKQQRRQAFQLRYRSFLEENTVDSIRFQITEKEKREPQFKKGQKRQILNKLKRFKQLQRSRYFTISKACKIINITKPTLRKYLGKGYLGEVPDQLEWKKCGKVQRKDICSRKIKEFIDNNHGNVTQRQVYQHIKKFSKYSFCQGTIQYRISKDLGYTRKKCVEINPEIYRDLNMSHQKKVAEVLFKAHELGKNLIYIDETSFTRDLGNKFGYALKGNKVTFPFKKPLMTIGGICAINRERLIGMKMRDGANNKISFLNFLIELLTTLKKEEPGKYEDTLLYLDNASYHTCHLIMEFFRILKVNYIFAPAYCSPVNPIEYYFSQIKRHLDRCNIQSKTHLKQFIGEALESVSCNNYEGYTRKSQREWLKLLNNTKKKLQYKQDADLQEEQENQENQGGLRTHRTNFFEESKDRK